MDVKKEKLACLSGSHFRELLRHYIGHPIALYTGAGVSRSDEESEEPEYGLAGWNGFMRAVIARYPRITNKDLATFDRNVKHKWGDEPWKMADWISKKIGVVTFKRLVTSYVQREENFPKRRGVKQYAQLGGNFLAHAPTLNAVCAFCAKLEAISEDARPTTYLVGLNPRVRAVITTNYDPFLEAGSSTMYRLHRLKPVGRKGSSVGRAFQLPVFHIHGYVQYPKKRRSKQEANIPSMVDPVLTTKNYELARQDDPFCFTLGTEVHVLRHYRVLFVGFSFRDQWVNEVLCVLNHERVERGNSRPYHYALMTKKEVNEKKEANGKDFFKELGVKPIQLDEYSQVPEVLKCLYKGGLRHDYKRDEILLPKVPKANRRQSMDSRKAKRQGPSKRKTQGIAYISNDQYWDHLCRCRNCWVGTKNKDCKQSNKR